MFKGLVVRFIVGLHERSLHCLLAQCATVSSYLDKGFSYFYAEHIYALVSVIPFGSHHAL